MIKTHDFGVWIKVFRVNFDYFAMNIFIGRRENHSLMRYFKVREPKPNIPIFHFSVIPIAERSGAKFNTILPGRVDNLG